MVVNKVLQVNIAQTLTTLHAWAEQIMIPTWMKSV